MKEYIIWLVANGGGPVGTMEDDEAERLKQAFKEQRPGIYEFKDTDGSTLVDLRQVAVLAINDVPDTDRKAGF